MIILEDDFLFKVGVKSTFNFVKYFLERAFGHDGPWTNNTLA